MPARLFVSLVTVNIILLASSLRADKIPGVGYSPPPNAVVFHCDTSNDNLIARCGGTTTPLNVNVPWSGSNGDVAGYVGRYLGGRSECAASWICGVGNENECLVSSQKLREMFQRGELGDRNRFNGEPTRVECHDFGAQNVWGPISTGLRAQPSDPPGCCRNTLPCIVDEPGRRPGEVWQEPVTTPSGGRRGCFLKQREGSTGQHETPKERCWILKVKDGVPTLQERACP